MLRSKSYTIAAALALAAPSAAWAQAQNDILIGVDEPLTGDVAASGNYVTDGARIAEAAINAHGGVLGRKIRLVIEDNKSNPRDAATAAQRLIVRDHVPVLMGAWGSTFTLSVMPMLIENSVPMVVETSSSPKITTSGNPWVFRIAPTSEMEAKSFAAKISQFNPPIRKADFLAVNNDFGLGSINAFKTALSAAGVQIGAIQTMSPDATDMSAQLATIKKSGGDTLFLTTEVEQIILVLKQAAEQRLGQRVITDGGSSSPDQLIAQAGAAANGNYFTVFFAPWFPEKAPYPDLAKAFVQAWTGQKYPVPGMTEGYRGYDGISTIAAAITAAGKVDPDAIRQALWKVKVKGLNGDISFVPQGPKGKESGQNEANVYIVKIVDGKVTLQ